MIFGNSHSWYYDENSIGNGLLKNWAYTRPFGINVGKIDGFFYPDSTRYIGYNPDSTLIQGIANGGDRTIEEFPFYSYLIGDLHAHVVSTMIVLLIMAVCIALVARIFSLPVTERLPLGQNQYPILFMVKEEMKRDYIKHMILTVITPETVAFRALLLLGCAQMTNYWDFLICFIFCSMAMLVAGTLRSQQFTNAHGIASFILALTGILLTYLKFGGDAFDPCGSNT